jgi:23S rRNA (adenine2030-N6)-methyltransferase
VNYRHAFHAGNHADVFKHAALTLVLDWLLAKPAPFAVLDTHAGLGVYHLTSDEARRTGEAIHGAQRVFGRVLKSAPSYSRLLAEMNPASLALYPGSPEIVLRMVRPEDRLIACELHPDDAETLRRRYRSDPRIAVHHRDGYEAVGAFVPPTERRGLVLIDPPFEAKDEAERLARTLAAGLRKWPTGTYVAWYPIKDYGISETLAAAARATPFPKTLRVEFLPYHRNGSIMAGSGLIICNAPWRLDEQLSALCEELNPLLSDGSATWRVDWLTKA